MADSAHDAQRIGTREREESISVLGEHFEAGRITAEEYGERTATAGAAVVRGDLTTLFEDLPEPRPSFLRPPLPQAPPPGVVPGSVPVAGLYAPPPMPQYQFSPKSKVAAGVLNIVLPFGIGRFYAGNTGIAVAQLLVTIFTFGVGALWSFIDGIVLIVNGGLDGEGRPLRD
ncbi:DUF1707 domain-containing protein [Sciscionella marina]|uniref:DUF1707 domain-containing protein n=1 Tax=Sciscionella marina TaxID=508770 RepID=UPI000381C41D|nr:DUF1707 domain-containing protein [Sciscionella marina]